MEARSRVDRDVAGAERRIDTGSPDTPLQSAGSHRTTVCSAPLLFVQVTVPPAAMVVCRGTKQNPVQSDEIVTVAPLAACGFADGFGEMYARAQLARRRVRGAVREPRRTPVRPAPP